MKDKELRKVLERDGIIAEYGDLVTSNSGLDGWINERHWQLWDAINELADKLGYEHKKPYVKQEIWAKKGK